MVTWSNPLLRAEPTYSRLLMALPNQVSSMSKDEDFICTVGKWG